MLRKGTFILMKTKIQDMTSGSPGRLIILFAIPLMLGNICQQLYTMVDTMVVGQVAGVEALAALGAVDFLMWVVTGISTGLTQGFSIQLSQYYGAKDFENLRKSLAHSYRLTAFIAAGVLILSQSFASLVLTGLHTPSNIIGMSLLYLRIIFCGIPATAAYNMFASALRAMGNSKTPLTAMIIASVLNVSSDQSRFYACLRHECPPDEAWYSCCIPEYHHRCGRSGSPVCDQWLRFPFCSRIYSYKQALWSVGNGCYFLWICHRYLCGSESGSQKD